MAQIELDGVSKRYDATVAVDSLSLTINEHEFVVLVGPSGCGKSTTLRMIAGLEDISEGELRIGNERVNELSPGQRDIAMVFQNYALYPHMSVAQNIAFGLRRRRLPRQEVKDAVANVARMLELEPLLQRRPRALSGGQRQRVAIGRALVRNPRAFLFDEPLSNLDAKLRAQMRLEIKQLHQQVPTTTVYVTHDQVEAMTMADRVVVMNGGRIEQMGTPMDIYRHPQTRFVAAFIGSPSMNFFAVRLVAEGDQLQLVLANGLRLLVPERRRPDYAGHVGQSLTLGIRPEALRLAQGGAGNIIPDLVAMVTEPLGTETLVYFSLAGSNAAARLPPDCGIVHGDRFDLAFDMDAILLFDDITDRVIAPHL